MSRHSGRSQRLEVERRRKGRGILKSPSGARVAQQLDDLHECLVETNRTMTENERMLGEFQSVSHSHSRELDSLRNELEQSRELLRVDLERSSHQPSVHFEEEKMRLERELKRERLARERAELNASQVVNLLDASLHERIQHPRSSTPLSSHSTHPLRSTEQELRDKLLHEIQIIRRELSEARLGASHKLASNVEIEKRIREIEEKLGRNGQQGGYDHSLEALASEVRQIRDELASKEKDRELQREVKNLESMLDEEHHLLTISRGESHHLTNRVQELGSQLEQIKGEKEKTLSHLENTTHRLNKSLEEHDDLVRQIEDLHSRLALSEEQCLLTEERHTALQMRYQQQETTQEKLNMQIGDIESKLSQYRIDHIAFEDECRQLKQKLAEKSLVEQRLQHRCENLETQLLERRQERMTVERLEQKAAMAERECTESRLEMTQLKVELQRISSERNALIEKTKQLETDVERNERLRERLKQEIRDLTSRLSGSEEKRSNLVGQLEDTIKRSDYTNEEKQALQSQILDLESRASSAERRAASTHSQALQALKKYKLQVNKLEREKQTMSQDKEQFELLCQEMQQELEELHALIGTGKDEISSLKAENRNLQHLLQSSTSNNTKLLTKINRVSKAYQSLKLELTALQIKETQLREESLQHEREAEQARQDLHQKEKELVAQLAHYSDLKLAEQKRCDVVAKLECKTKKLQLQLVDEQSMVKAVRRQQFRVLDDQQKMGDELSRSFEDTEKLREKYIKIKKIYEDKVAALECKVMDTTNEENESLHQKLCELQANLLQQAEENEVILKAISGEIDALVERMGKRAQVPVFPTLVDHQTDTRKCIADMLAKLQWLQTEFDSMLLQESKLKKRLQYQVRSKEDIRHESSSSSIDDTEAAILY